MNFGKVNVQILYFLNATYFAMDFRGQITIAYVFVPILIKPFLHWMSTIAIASLGQDSTFINCNTSDFYAIDAGVVCGFTSFAGGFKEVQVVQNISPSRFLALAQAFL